MRSVAVKSAAAIVLAVGAIVGCESVLEGLMTGGDPDTGFVQRDNSYSDAPVSPGGTGGIIDDQVVGDGQKTQSFFTAYQVDPASEDSAGPKFVTAADIDNDGRLDLISAWNESQPIQLHLQRRDGEDNISFRTINLGGTTPIAITAGVEVGYINDDEWLDIVVLVKATGYVTICPAASEAEEPTVIGVMDGLIIVLFNPGNAAAVEDGDRWELMMIGESNRFPGIDEVSFYDAATKPELNGFVSLAVAEMDGQPGDDIVVAFNAADCETLGQHPPINTVEIYPNPGGSLSESGSAWTFVTIDADAPKVKDILLMDIDNDGDLDIVSSWTDSVSTNIRWRRNPLIPHEPGGPSGTDAVHQGRLTWEFRVLGHVATGADILAQGDIDSDGEPDVVVRSTAGQIVQWFRRPTEVAIEPIFPPPDPVPDRDTASFPWQVYTLAVFDKQEPEAIAVGDLTGNGQVEVLIAAEGAVFWYDGNVADSIFDEWISNTMIRDSVAEETDPGAGAPSDPSPPGGAGVTSVDASTHINTLLVVDLDGDGKNDVVGTLDRRGGSGLSDDRLVWYRNTRTEEMPE